MNNISIKTLKASSESSMSQKLFKYTSDPSYISFAVGFPANNILPAKRLKAIASKVLDSETSLQYQLPRDELKQQLVEIMKLKNIECNKEQIFLTSGAQQGLSLVSSLLLSQGNQHVLVEELAYKGFVQAIAPFDTNIISLTVSEDGLDPEILKIVIEDAIKQGKKPTLIYLISEGHNPLGVNISNKNIEKISEILQHYQIYAIEDDAYGFISYERQNLKLKSILPDLTFYVGTFSKILAPSLRLGWMVVPKSYAETLANLKEGADLNLTSFSQLLLSQYLKKYNFSDHIDEVLENYRRKRDLMAKHLNINFADKIEFNVPRSGIFMWVKFKQEIDPVLFLDLAIEQKLVFLPGRSFAIDRENDKFKNSIRLCFTFCSEAQIIEGIKKLKIAFEAMIYNLSHKLENVTG